MSLLKSSVIVSSWTAFSRILGFVRDIVIANKLGAGLASDAFFIALILPNLVRRLFAEGAFNMAFVPLLSDEKETHGSAAALDFASRTFTALIGTVFVLVLLAEIFMPFLVRALAPGFAGNPEKLALTIFLGRVTFPYLMLISIAAFYGALCNTWGKFALYAAVPAVLNLSFLASLFILPDLLGISPALAASIAVPLGGIGQVLCMVWGAKRCGIQLTFKRPQHDKLKELWLRLGPAALGVGVLQLSFLIDNFLASFLYDSAISYLQYANRFYQFPLALIGVATATVLLPHLSKKLSAGDIQGASEAFSKAFVGAMALGFGAFVGLFVLAVPLMSTVLVHGEFTQKAAIFTAWAMMGYAAGLPGYILTKLTASAFFAAGDTKTPLKAGILALGVNLVANIILMQFFGHVGIALATAISGWVNAGFQLYMLNRKGLLHLQWTAIMRPLALALGVSLVMGAVMLISALIVPYGGGLLYNMAWLGGMVALGSVVFVVGVQFTRVMNLSQIYARLRK